MAFSTSDVVVYLLRSINNLFLCKLQVLYKGAAAPAKHGPYSTIVYVSTANVLVLLQHRQH